MGFPCHLNFPVTEGSGLTDGELRPHERPTGPRTLEWPWRRSPARPRFAELPAAARGLPTAEPADPWRLPPAGLPAGSAVPRWLSPAELPARPAVPGRLSPAELPARPA